MKKWLLYEIYSENLKTFVGSIQILMTYVHLSNTKSVASSSEHSSSERHSNLENSNNI